MLALVAIALIVGALGGGFGPDASGTPDPSRVPPATVGPTSVASSTRTEEPSPIPTPIPTPSPLPDKVVGELCAPEPSACAVPAGRHRSPSFEPTVEVDLDGSWWAVRHYEDTIVIGREDGLMTLASGVTIVYRGGVPIESRGRPDDLVRAFEENPDISILSSSEGKVAGQKATILELVPSGSARVPLFDTSRDTFFIEVETVTRIAVFEAKKETIVIVLEGAGGSHLDVFAPAAELVVESIRFR